MQDNNGTYGPDGPWQALVLLTMDSGYDARSGYSEETVLMPVWPTYGEITELPTTHIGARYSPNETGQPITLRMNETNDGLMQMGLWDPWYSGYFDNYYNIGLGWVDNITLMDMRGSDKQVNATIIAANQWNITMRSGENYTAQAGNLGLGPIGKDVPSAMADKFYPRSIIEQLIDAGTVDANFWSLHMGSVPMGQMGSCGIGGYERNRALGQLGVFEYSPANNPGLFLVDVVLGVQEGGSPFNVSASELPSVYRGPSATGGKFADIVGGKRGSTLVMPTPGSPGIYLPLGTCEAAASYLPVTWDDKTGYYLWNVDDPNYARIVNSPAYLGFVLADRTATNITIKVPFKLLNLTLESPITEVPTPYFPCTPFQGHEYTGDMGFFGLGRAFLQAAFMGVSYDHNLVFLAQAPGPDMAQSVVVPLKSDDVTIETNPDEQFAESWRSHWTVLPDDGTTSHVPPTNSIPAAADDRSEPSGLSTGAKAGAAVGSVLGALCIIGLAVLFFWRRRKQATQKRGSQVPSEPAVPDPSKTQEDDSKLAGRAEIGENEYHETGNALSHEMETPQYSAEAPPYSAIYEMPGSEWQPGPRC